MAKQKISISDPQGQAIPRSQAEETLALHIRAARLPEPEREYRFHVERRWRLDFAWPRHMIAAEVEGVTYQGGRHQRRKGYEMDCEKYNAATIAGWTLLRFTQEQIRSGAALALLEEAFRQGRVERA